MVVSGRSGATEDDPLVDLFRLFPLLVCSREVVVISAAGGRCKHFSESLRGIYLVCVWRRMFNI